MTVVLFTVGCPKSQDQSTGGSAQTGTQDQSSDPASANLAPADSSTAQPASYSAPNTGGSYDQAPNQASDQGSDDPGYGEQPVE
jgi:hypothetical protein